jgi:hypothetical protein
MAVDNAGKAIRPKQGPDASPAGDAGQKNFKAALGQALRGPYIPLCVCVPLATILSVVSRRALQRLWHGGSPFWILAYLTLTEEQSDRQF